MPLILKTITEEGSHLALWRMSETIEELKGFEPTNNFPAPDEKNSHPLRLKQRLCTHLLLGEIADVGSIELSKDAEGRPWPANLPGYLSISHTTDIVAAVYHPSRPCGVDIEHFSERILKLASRFVHPSEGQQIRTEHVVQDTTLIWCVKECMYKQLNRKGVIFRDELRVELRNQLGEYSHQGVGLDLFPNPPLKLFYRWRILDNLILVHTIA